MILVTKTFVQLRLKLSEFITQIIHHHKFYVFTRYGKPEVMMIPYSKKWERDEIEADLFCDDPTRVELPPGPEYFLRTDRSGRTIKQILEQYINGPGGEPDIADAHDYLMAINDIMEMIEC